jgi:large repetitive protein
MVIRQQELRLRVLPVRVGSQTAWFLGGSSVAFASTNGTIVVTPSVTSTYVVSCMGTVTSSGTSTSVTITPVNINQPTGLSALPTSVTTAGTPVTLTATGCGAQTVVWENLSTVNPRIVIPTATNIYTFRCSNAPCTSSGQGSVTVLFGPCPLTLTLASTVDDVPAGIVSKIASQNPGGNISATNKVTGSANVYYTARVIDLNPGFLASPSAVFKAEPGGCL